MAWLRMGRSVWKPPYRWVRGMIDVRGWETPCMLDSGRGYRCRTDYHGSSLISTSHTSHYSWTSSILSSPTTSKLPLPSLPAETLKRHLQCLCREIQSWSAGISLDINTQTLLLLNIWSEVVPKPQTTNALQVFVCTGDRMIVCLVVVHYQMNGSKM